MSNLSKNQIYSFMNNDRWTENGREVFNYGIVDLLSVDTKENQIYIKSLIKKSRITNDNYYCFIEITKDKITDYTCSCPVKVTYNKPCKHLAATLFSYVSKLGSLDEFVNHVPIKENIKLIIDTKTWNRCFIKYKLGDKLYNIFPYNDNNSCLELWYKHYGKKINKIEELKIKLDKKRDFKFLETIKNLFSFIYIQENPKANETFLFTKNLQTLYLKLFKFIKDNNINFGTFDKFDFALKIIDDSFANNIYKKATSRIIYSNNNKDIEELKKYFGKNNINSIKGIITSNKKREQLNVSFEKISINLLNINDNENQACFLIFQSNQLESYIYIVSYNSKLIKNALKQINEQKIPLKLFKFYLHIFDLAFGFSNLLWHNKTDYETYELQGTSLTIDVKLYKDQTKKIPILVIEYIYKKFNYLTLKEETRIFDINDSNLALKTPQELLEKANQWLSPLVEKNLKYYNNELNAYYFKKFKELNSVMKFLKTKIGDRNWIVSMSKDLIFTEMEKRKFNINVIKSGIDFVDIQWKLDGYTREDVKKIIRGFIKKQEFITLNNDIKIYLDEFDFSSFKHQLILHNTNLKEIVKNDLKIKVKPRNFILLKDYADNLNVVKEFIENLNNPNRIQLDLNPKIKQIIKPYQEDGIKWLINHYLLKTGSILADEMGLGKTLQVIGLLDFVYKENKAPSLIVVPAALLYNWKKEVEKYSNNLKILIIDGDKKAREKLYKDNFINNQIIVISYTTLKNDLDYFKDIQFEIVVIDEGHFIKNRATNNAQTVKSIKSNFNVVLSGTPMENNPSEIWSLFDFIMPNYMNSYNNFIEVFMSDSEVKTDLLKNKIKSFILRRTKKDVLKDLPEKFEKIIYVTLNEQQKILYANFVGEINKLKNEIHVKDWNKNKIAFLSKLTKLRQICCNPKLLYENIENNGSKFQACIDLIEQILERKEKVLIFSQFTSNFDFICEFLDNRNIDYSIITGETSKKDRVELVDEFNNSKDINVFLISLKAGGVGLNLTSANNVIHYDFWWNINAENQATDRAHRIGQNTNVNIYKIVTVDSIEEKIIELQKQKQYIIESVLDFENSEQKNLSMKEILEVLKL